MPAPTGTGCTDLARSDSATRSSVRPDASRRRRSERPRKYASTTTVRKNVEHAVGEVGHDGQHDRAHPELQVDRQQRGDGDDERGRAVAVERDQARQHSGEHHEPDRVVAHRPQDEPDHRIEQPDVDHRAEVDDREEQERRRRGEGLDRVHDRVDDAVLGRRTDAGSGHDERERQRDENERQRRRQPLASIRYMNTAIMEKPRAMSICAPSHLVM